MSRINRCVIGIYLVSATRSVLSFAILQVVVKVEGGACTKGTAYTFAEWKQKGLTLLKIVFSGYEYDEFPHFALFLFCLLPGEDPGTQLLTNYPSSENIIAWAQAILASP